MWSETVGLRTKPVWDQKTVLVLRIWSLHHWLGINQVKPSICYRRLEKLVLLYILDLCLSSFMVWNVRVIEQFWVKEC